MDSLQRVSSSPPSDIGLGEVMVGWEATRRIKSDPQTAGIPIVALTASAFESDRWKSIAVIRLTQR